MTGLYTTFKLFSPELNWICFIVKVNKVNLCKHSYDQRLYCYIAINSNSFFFSFIRGLQFVKYIVVLFL